MKQIVLLVVRTYRLLLSPYLPPSCRYQPTCSQYAEEAIDKYGLFKGGMLALKRISRCHPWGRYGYDPLR